ncbi:MAG: carboxypeptidase M32 [Clostridia bacterium]|nr:carboxypeptidase M32 [Clostridia bacterium]
MQLHQAREQLMKLQAKMSAFDHAMGLIYYDGSTAAPKGTAQNRGRTLSILSEEHYKLSTGEETVQLLEYLDAEKENLTEKEQRMVFLLLRSIRQMQKIPMEEYVAYQELLVEADDAWHTAKEKSDFPLFEPFLEKIFETNIRFARYCAPDMEPYDYWLNEYEDGLTMSQCDVFFATLRSRLVPLIQKIRQKQNYLDDTCLFGNFPEHKQALFSDKLMEVLGLDRSHVTIATTEHPFTTSLGSHFDTRITTHYIPNNVASSMYSVIHEGGHALYDTGSADDLAYTVLDGGVSMGIHESQSRFYENLLGRSRAFIWHIFPIMQSIFPLQMQGVGAEDIYRAVNRVQPSLIRVDADEVTYCLHVMIRYELEKKVMCGKLSVHDLPKEWNRLYKEYLGVTVPDDARGVLQDSHWSGGAIGYFPSYALGSAYGVQLLNKMRETVDVDTCLKEGKLQPINDWNREHIWKHGSLYPPKKLLEMALDAPFDPAAYTDYLERKYSDLYRL